MKTISVKQLVAATLGAIAVGAAPACDLVIAEGEGEGEGEGEDPCLPSSSLSADFTIAADCDVELPNGVEVQAGARLTIEPGATLRFGSGQYLGVRTDGVLVAAGTEEDPITLRGTAAGWGGLDVDSASADNALAFVSILDAGDEAPLFGRAAALNLRDGGRLDAQDVTITGSRSAGLSLFAGAQATFARIDVNGSAGAAAVVNADVAHLLNDTVLLAGEPANAIARVIVEPGAFDSDRTWSKLDVPYELTDELSLDATLTLSPGVSVLGRTDARFLAQVDGGLKAEGTAEDRITFAPARAGDGFGGIAFQSNTINNVLAFVDISGAGVGDGILFQPETGAIYLDEGSRARIEDVTVTDTEGYALVLANDDISLTLARAVFSDSSDGSVSLHANELSQLGDDTDYGDAIDVRDGAVSDDGTWANYGVTVNFAERVQIAADIVVADGNDLAFASDVAVSVETGGTFKVEDTSAAVQTRLRGQEATAGFWSGVFFDTNSVNNVIDGASLSHAGGTPVLFGEESGVFIYGGASATITDTAFSTISGDGIHVASGGTVTQSGNTFTAVSGLNINERP